MKKNRLYLVLFATILFAQCGGSNKTTDVKGKADTSANYTEKKNESQSKDGSTEPEQKEAVVIAKSGLTLRDKPSQDGRVITLLTTNSVVNVLEKGEAVEVKKVKSNWYKVKFGKYEGYCFGGFLSFGKKVESKKVPEKGNEEVIEGIERALVSTKSGLVLRANPSHTGKNILVVPDNQEVDIIQYTEEGEYIDGIYGFWLKVSFNKKEGYLFSAYLNFAKAVVSAKSGLTLRKGPGKSEAQITVIPVDAVVYLLNDQGMGTQEVDENGYYWMKVRYGNFEGYAFSEFLLISEGC